MSHGDGQEHRRGKTDEDDTGEDRGREDFVTRWILALAEVMSRQARTVIVRPGVGGRHDVADCVARRVCADRSLTRPPRQRHHLGSPACFSDLGLTPVYPHRPPQERLSAHLARHPPHRSDVGPRLNA